MLEPLPFALAASGCPPHAELAVSMAAAFHDVDAALVDGALDRLAEQMMPVPSDPVAALRAVADLWREDLLPAPAEDAGAVDLDCLFIDRAMSVRRADPLIQAVLAIEAGRRCGAPLGLVSNGSDHCVAHTRLEEPLVVRSPTGQLADGRTLAPVLSWRCAHEACGLLLDEMEDRLLRCNALGDALRCAQLRLHLPLDDRGEQCAQTRLAGVRARLN
jgi:hypothetical protein